MTDNYTYIGAKRPNCDVCEDGAKRPAIVDGKTRMGPWAFMCDCHYESVGTGLGLGKGQLLILTRDHDRVETEIIDLLREHIATEEDA